MDPSSILIVYKTLRRQVAVRNSFKVDVGSTWKHIRGLTEIHAFRSESLNGSVKMMWSRLKMLTSVALLFVGLWTIVEGQSDRKSDSPLVWKIPRYVLPLLKG